MSPINYPKMVQASTDSTKSLKLNYIDPLTAQTLTSKVDFGINHTLNMQLLEFAFILHKQIVIQLLFMKSVNLI